MKHFDACWFGRVAYAEALALMEHFADRAALNDQEVLMLMEHPPVVTMGRSADPANLLLTPEEYERRGFELHRIGRGGDVTFHGPGQLMGYPITKVGRLVTKHVDTMFDTLKEMLLAYGIEAHYEKEHPGLWVGSNKVAAVGVEIKNQISRHGFALNVHRNHSGFEVIVPCGLSHRGTIYMSELAETGTLDRLAQEFTNRYSLAKRKPVNYMPREQFIEKHNIAHLITP